MTLFGFVVKSTFRNRRRAVSTIASITVSFALLSILGAGWYTFYTIHGSGGAACRLVTRNRISLFFPLLSFYRNQIRAMPGVLHVAQLNWWGGTYKTGGAMNTFASYGTDANEIFDVYDEWSIDAEQLLAFKADAAGAAVPRVLAQRYGWKLGDKIFIKGTITPVNLDLTVRAIFDAPNKFEGLLFHWEPVVESFPALRGLEGFFVTRVDSPKSVALIVKAIDEKFRNAPQPTKSESESAFQLETLAMLGNVKLLILSISAATIFAVLLVCANTSAMAVRERIRELAVMRALGYSMSRVVRLSLYESVVLSGIGGIVGICLAKIALIYLGGLPAGRILNSVNLGVVPAGAVVLVAVGVGLASSLLSVLIGARGDVARGLRHVG